MKVGFTDSLDAVIIVVRWLVKSALLDRMTVTIRDSGRRKNEHSMTRETTKDPSSG